MVRFTEIIGEEIYDEFDQEGQGHLGPLLSPDAKRFFARRRRPDASPAARGELSAEPTSIPRGAQTVPSSPNLNGGTLVSSPPPLSLAGDLQQPQPTARRRSGASSVIGKVFGGVRRANTLPGPTAEAAPGVEGQAELEEKPSETTPEEKKGAPDKAGDEEDNTKV